MTIKNKNIFVTGAAGFLGSHLCDRLLKEGAYVIGIDNFLTGRKENLLEASSSKNFTFIEADVINAPATYLPEEVIPDVVFHLASPASPPRYQEHPIETYLVNSLGTHNLLQYLLVNNPTARFVYASSSEVYGDPKEHPQKETYWGNVNPNGVRSCYDEGKRFGETICGVHFRDFGIDTRIMRIFNTYGPRMNPIDGRMLPNFVQQALRGESITIFGDGSQTRSFCYVDDLIEGMFLLSSVDTAQDKTINLGNPIEKTVLEMATIIKQAVNSSSDVVYQPIPNDDPTQRRPDISKAKQVLDWEPKISLEDGLAQTIQYFRTEILR